MTSETDGNNVYFYLLKKYICPIDAMSYLSMKFTFGYT